MIYLTKQQKPSMAFYINYIITISSIGTSSTQTVYMQVTKYQTEAKTKSSSYSLFRARQVGSMVIWLLRVTPSSLPATTTRIITTTLMQCKYEYNNEDEEVSYLRSNFKVKQKLFLPLFTKRNCIKITEPGTKTLKQE